MRFFVFSGIMFPFVMTALGAAAVFVAGGGAGARMQRLCLGFAAGVMMAAAAFSLLVPASEQMEAAGGAAWRVLPGAFMAGAGAILALDGFVRSRERLLLLAMTLHNVPEGMAVGLAFAVHPAAAAALALGIGLQNLPEGAAVSLPLCQGGMSRRGSFLLGALSGAVEPLAALAMMAFAGLLGPALPAMMAFAAGAMAVVVFDDLAPMACASRGGVIASMAGFALMMAMDLGLG